MLPQMMPLPWVMLFFMIFLCFYSICMYIKVFYVVYPSRTKLVNSSLIILPW